MDTTSDYTAEARRAAAAILDQHDLTLPIQSRDLLISLVARGWLDGCREGMERAQAIYDAPRDL